MKHIVSFYSKAKALDRLVSLYEMCAQIEIDEYRDYEKASQAIREALKYCKKLPSGDREGDLAQRLEMIERFTRARKLIEDNPKDGIAMCARLLDEIPMNYQVRATSPTYEKTVD